ncbi:hypothetical protein BDV33DRAFT_207206 [Aspergillus novoparasiticus]|uniref:Uncharacterized protein n=1 Tax=Aspergillus novoparasiticus TaxID=986946 RepID=A0A5N6EIE8_9EURO|nr:hypothetical protein BDV33DRAFT_207206 [Aspergillus novoparasiticus]
MGILTKGLIVAGAHHALRKRKEEHLKRHSPPPQQQQQQQQPPYGYAGPQMNYLPPQQYDYPGHQMNYNQQPAPQSRQMPSDYGESYINKTQDASYGHPPAYNQGNASRSPQQHYPYDSKK